LCFFAQYVKILVLYFSIGVLYPWTEREAKDMAKYLDPKADVTFKKVFGEHMERRGTDSARPVCVSTA